MKRFLSLILVLVTLSSSTNLYEYKANVISVYDADTITASVDLGFNVSITEKIRLYGIDAPELRGSERIEGLRSRDSLRAWINGKDIIIRTIKDKKGKYGRYLGIIFIGNENINDKLVSEGLAVYKEY